MAHLEAVTQRVFEEHRVERRVVLLEIGGTFDIAGTMFANLTRDLVDEGGTGRRKRDTRCRWSRRRIFEYLKKSARTDP